MTPEEKESGKRNGRPWPRFAGGKSRNPGFSGTRPLRNGKHISRKAKKNGKNRNKNCMRKNSPPLNKALIIRMVIWDAAKVPPIRGIPFTIMASIMPSAKVAERKGKIEPDLEETIFLLPSHEF